MAIVIDGKKVMKTEGNIKIVPLEAPKGSIFRDEKEIYVFPHSVSRKKRNEVFRIMTNSKIERIARAISSIFHFPEGLDQFNTSQSYVDSLPLPFIPEYNFTRYELKRKFFKVHTVESVLADIIKERDKGRYYT